MDNIETTLVYCPLHKAASALLETLEAIGNERESNFPSTADEYIRWWLWARGAARAATYEARKEKIETAIAQAKEVVKE